METPLVIRVLPARALNGWQVLVDGARRPVSIHERKSEAYLLAHTLASRGYTLVVHDEDGRVELRLPALREAA